MRKLFIHLGIACSILGLFLMADTALAQGVAGDPTLTNPGNSTGGLWSFLKMDEVMASVVRSIAMSILGLFAFLMGMAGVLLNYSISFLVIGMGSLITDHGFGVSIESMWRLMRDLVNLCFVFALIYIGITTILKSDSSGAKTALASIIISALLVNFSLYFSKAIIDVSNITADRIFRNMAGNNTSSTIWDPKYGISAVFMHRLGVGTLFLGAPDNSQTGVLKKALESKETGVPFIIIYALGASILLFKLAFAFAFGAFILVVRFVMLLLLMIFSPVAFLPSALPKIGDLRKKWWNMMLTQAFVAPVYLFGIYLTLRILMSTPWSNGEEGLISLFTDGSAMAGMQFLLFYVIAIIMIIGTTMAAKSLSSSGAAVAQVFAKNIVTRAAIGAGRSIGSYAGRNVIGKGANRLGEWNQKLEGSQTGRKFKRLVSIASLGSFDERTRQALVKKAKTAKFGGTYSLEDDKKFAKDQTRIQNIEERKRDREEKIQKYDQALKTGGPGDIETTRAEAEKEIQKMTSSELEELELEELEKIAGLLSNKQMDGIKDSKDGYTEGTKDAVKKARTDFQDKRFKEAHSVTVNSVTRETTIRNDYISNMKPGDVAKLDKKLLLSPEMQTLFTGEILKRIHDDQVFNRTDAQALGTTLRNNSRIDATADGYLSSARGQGYYGKYPQNQSAGANTTQTQQTQTQPQQSAQTQPNESNFRRLERERLERDRLRRRQ